MKRLLLPALLCSLTFTAFAQNTPPAAPARPKMDAAPTSPEILPDGRVTFRCRAPKATEVKATGQFGPEVKLEKGDNGLWTATTAAPVAGGVYEYSFRVDGMNIIDGMNPAIKPQRQPGTSILVVPSNPPAAWDLTDIPHGGVTEHNYLSKSLGKWRRVMVYTPPGYRSDAAPLPVLYLSHGFSDNDQSWSAHGRANFILDTLIAEKKAEPMLIVMPDAHALPPGPGYKDDYSLMNTEAFCRDLIEDVVPLVEKTYTVKKDPAGRAFAGLSMGGHHALTVALAHHDTFSWIGAFSSAPPSGKLIESGLANPEAVNKDLKLFWVACGDKDFLFERNNQFDTLLKGKAINHEYIVTPNDDHSWPVWRRYLITFAPKLFR